MASMLRAGPYWTRARASSTRRRQSTRSCPAHHAAASRRCPGAREGAHGVACADRAVSRRFARCRLRGAGTRADLVQAADAGLLEHFLGNVHGARILFVVCVLHLGPRHARGSAPRRSGCVRHRARAGCFSSVRGVGTNLKHDLDPVTGHHDRGGENTRDTAGDTQLVDGELGRRRAGQARTQQPD